MEFQLLHELVAVFGLSLIVTVICYQFKIAPIVGFLLTGILSGPNAFALIQSEHAVEVMAEIGIILLLFTIGVEFSLKSMLQIKRLLLIGGIAQVLLTLSLSFVICKLSGLPGNESVLIGLLVTLSSTALVLKLLQERGEIDSLHGRIAFAVLLLQDIAIVPMMLLVPYLGGDTKMAFGAAAASFGHGLAVLAVTLIFASLVVPKMFDQIARTRNRELFLLSVIVVCFTVAFVTQKAGLSLSLGALLAGLIISESEYSHQALSHILPFQQIFTTLFFVSVGMLLDINFTMDHLPFIASVSLGVIIFKTLVCVPAALLLGYSVKTGLMTGLAISQIGEFSFVLAKTAGRFNIMTEEHYQLFLSVSVITMALTPFIISHAAQIASVLAKLPLPEKLVLGRLQTDESVHLFGHEKLRDHAIVVGFGVAGQMVVKSLEFAKINHVILEMNPETVKKERRKGRKIVFGDASQEAVLLEEGVREAKIAIVVISGYVMTRQIVDQIRKLNPLIHIIVRTRMVKEIHELYALGANEVIPEEFETGVELLGRTLSNYLIPFEEIDSFIKAIRSNEYEIARAANINRSVLNNLSLHVSDLSTHTFRISDKSQFKDRSLAALELRNKFGVTLLAVKRGSETLANPGGEYILMEDDILFLLGENSDFEKIKNCF